MGDVTFVNGVTASNLLSGLTGTLPVNQGGTGQTTFTNGQMMIGNTTGNTLTKATLTAGTDFVVTNGTGSVTIGNTAKTVKILAKLISANMNTTADQAFTMTSGVTRGIISAIIATNASTSLTLAVGGIYNDTGKPAGGILVAATQIFSALTTSTKYVGATLATLTTTDVITSSTPIQLSLTTGQGTAATADIYIIGYDLA